MTFHEIDKFIKIKIGREVVFLAQRSLNLHRDFLGREVSRPQSNA